MTKRAPPLRQAGYVVKNCTFTNEASKAPPAVCASVTALAKAAEANAVAIATIARVLNSPDTANGPMINIGFADKGKA